MVQVFIETCFSLWFLASSFFSSAGGNCLGVQNASNHISGGMELIDRLLFPTQPLKTQRANVPGFLNLQAKSHQSFKSVSCYCFLLLFNLAGQEVTAQPDQSEIWQSQACSRPLCWHSSVIQQVNFWISKQASFLRQSLCLRSHLAGVSHQETSVKALFPKTALQTTRVLCGGS